MTVKSQFTVTIEETDHYQGYIKPLKAGSSSYLDVTVKNNTAYTSTVTLDELSTGLPASWLFVSNNSQSIESNHSKIFNLTINIPYGTTEGIYQMQLNFNTVGFDANYSFSHGNQTIIVDNSPPITPTFNLTSTSTSIRVYGWQSSDVMSKNYTDKNNSAGVLGIKSYNITLKNQASGSESTVSINATSTNEYTFQGLSSNTGYKVTVKANDLAGNYSSSDAIKFTAPAPPVISSSEQNYCNVSLNWTSTAGAVSYKVYNVTSSPFEIAETNNTSYTVTGLLAGTTYKFKVKAYNSSGSASDYSNELTISTLTVPIPIISGPVYVCSPGNSFSVTNKPPNVSLEWSQGPYISLDSISGDTAFYKSTGHSQSWIKATYNTGCGTASTTKVVDAGSPKPGYISIEFDAPPRRFTASIEGLISGESYQWYLNGVLKQDNYMTSAIFQRQVGSCGYRYDVQVAMTNQCGVSQRSYTTVYEPCYNNYTVYPNPATTEINIVENDELNQLSLESVNSEPKYIKSIKIIDINGFIHYNKTYPNLTKQASLKISHLKTGNYQLIVNEGEEQESYSFIKQ